MSARDHVTIVVEPSDYVLRNAGDMAMMEVALSRLAAMWPEADIAVFSDVADVASDYAPNVRVVNSTGRQLWLRTPLVPVRIVPRRLRAVIDRVGRLLRRRLPRLATAAIRRRLTPDEWAMVEGHLALVARADLVLATGMGGVTDVFPTYAFELLETLDSARRGGACTVMVGQGIGPIDERALRSFAANVLPGVDLIALREERAGRPMLRRLGVDSDRIVTTGDDAIELASVLAPHVLGCDVGVNVRISNYAAVSDDIALRIASSLRRAACTLDAPLRSVPISSVPGEDDRLAVRRLLGADVVESARAVDDAVATSVDDAIATIALCRVVVTGSYHAAVFALSMGVPAIGLAASRYYEDKFLGLADQFGLGCDVVLLSDPTAADDIADLVVAAWNRAPDMRDALRAAAQRQVDLGHAAYERIGALLERRVSSLPGVPLLGDVPA